jgi:dTDP-4-amino-4,6-dideoxygalactose transaminase
MIRYFDYRPELERYREEILKAIRRVLDSGRLILGPEVRAFEDECARRLEVGGTVGVASGTDALCLALRAVGVGPGDEVITVANAGVPTVAAIRSAGAEPRFVDVDPDTLLIDPARLEAARTSRTRCVLPVHLYGQAADLGRIEAFARAHGLRVVEDCAQAFGATYRGRAVGSIGDVGCYSFYPTKPLGAFGDGGLCATSDPDCLERLRSIRMYGFAGDRHAHVEGVNSRLDELQAAILRVKLRYLDDLVEERRVIAGLYRAGLRDSSFRLPADAAGSTHVYHLFVVRTGDRERAIEALEAAEIGYGIHYPEAVHLMEAYCFLGYDEGELPETERACREVLSLPIYPGLAPESVEQVVATLRGAGPAP